jgi:hypothetical protein
VSSEGKILDLKVQTSSDNGINGNEADPFPPRIRTGYYSKNWDIQEEMLATNKAPIGWVRARESHQYITIYGKGIR